MPYSFEIPSSKKTVLTRQITTQEYLNVYSLIANKDYKGLDLYTEKLFFECTENKEELNVFDKFAFLFSQKIMSHSFTITVVHTTPVNNKEEKINIETNLVSIYNFLTDAPIKHKNSYKEKNIEIEYGLPKNFSCKENYEIYSIKTDYIDKVDISGISLDTFKEILPLNFFTSVEVNLSNNNKLVDLKYFENIFFRKLNTDIETLLYLLDFIYSENIVNFYSLSLNLSKHHNIDFNNIKNLNMRELYLVVDIINKNAEEEQKKKKKTSFM